MLIKQYYSIFSVISLCIYYHLNLLEIGALGIKHYEIPLGFDINIAKSPVPYHLTTRMKIILCN